MNRAGFHSRRTIWILGVGLVLAIGASFLLRISVPDRANPIPASSSPRLPSSSMEVREAANSDRPAVAGHEGNAVGREAMVVKAELAGALREADTSRASLLIVELVNLQPGLAASVIADLPPGDLRLESCRNLGRAWAGIAPQAAMDWAAGLPDAEERSMAGQFVCYRVAEDNPFTALNLAKEAGFGVETPLVVDLAHQWAHRDLTAASAWIVGQPVGPPRDSMIARLALVLSQRDPSEACRLIVEQMAAGPEQDEAAISVVHQWGMRDAESAARWVAQFPPSPLRQRAEAELSGIAAHRSGDAAGDAR